MQRKGRDLWQFFKWRLFRQADLGLAEPLLVDLWFRQDCARLVQHGIDSDIKGFGSLEPEGLFQDIKGEFPLNQFLAVLPVLLFDFVDLLLQPVD